MKFSSSALRAPYKLNFKEYGDPRTLNLETGQYDERTPIDKQANEVVHFKIGSGAYGKPRCTGASHKRRSLS